MLGLKTRLSLSLRLARFNLSLSQGQLGYILTCSIRPTSVKAMSTTLKEQVMPGHRSMARFNLPQSKGQIGLIPAYPNQSSVQKAKLRVTIQNHCHKFYHARDTGTMF